MEKIANDSLWVEPHGDGVKIGLTNTTQEEIGAVTFVTLPKVGTQLTLGETLVEVEAEKSVSEFLVPFPGTVIEVNTKALENPAVLDDKNEANAWLVVLSKTGE